jgi:serine/threonine protein kinase
MTAHRRIAVPSLVSTLAWTVMEAGELVAQRYRLASLVGRGAMGVVWLARDERLDREVAVKQLLIEGSPDRALAEATPEEATGRAMREARIAARLRHPNAIAVHDVVAHDGKPCLIMEYLRSDALDAVMVARGGLPPREAAAIGAQIAAALAEAHAVGIVHRDVKPENVLITSAGTAKITDFGVSRAAGVSTVTATGVLAGTPAYLAPEIAGGAKATQSSDVFSLGATLYAAIEGWPPFGVDENPIALLHRVAAGEIAPPRRSGPLTDLLLWLLRRDPAERPSMRVARDALAAAAAGTPFPVPPPRLPTMLLPMPAPRPSRRAVFIGIAAVALLAAGVALGAILTDSSPGTTASPPPTSTTSTTSSTSQKPIVGTSTCEASYDVTSSWPNGYQVKVTIRNDGDQPLNGWQAQWKLPTGHQIDGLWQGDLTRDGTEVTVRNLNYNVTIPVGGEITFGFNATTNDDTHPVPEITCQHP